MSIEKRDSAPEGVRILTVSQEDGIKIIQEFWRAMPHGKPIVNQLDQKGAQANWGAILTMGDRTSVREGSSPNEEGKWVVFIRGNGLPLSSMAVSWLKGKGYLQ
jgi:hypothetical protein